VQGDIRNPVALDAVFAEYRPDAVMHFAALIEVPEGEQNPLRFWENNVGGVMTLLAAMKRAEVNKLVFSSTCATYGNPGRLPIREDEPQTPVNVYGRTKLAVERLLTDLSGAGELSFGALRYFNAAGASPSGGIGEEHDPEGHLIPNALKAAAGLGVRMQMFGDDYPTPDGTCIRDYIHVVDLARAHLMALDRLAAGWESFCVNLGTGKGVSIREILDAVQRVTGRPVPYEIAARRPGDAAQLYADVARARDLLGFTAERSDLDTIIRDAWNFHRPRWSVT
jgi:UDP-glucose-4-epimerase GalE